jgi:predicted esterase
VGLRADPDLKSLQELREFEEIVAVCRERHAAAQATSEPELLILQPDGGAPPYPILLALHGAGENAKDFAVHWQAATASGWLVGVPQSSQMFSPTRFTWRDLKIATQEILSHYDTMLKRHTADAHRTVLAGFSQGGRTAIWLTLSGILPARGFLGIACALPDEEIRKLLRDREPKHRGYLIVGTKDYVYEQTRVMADLLGSYSMPIEVETIEGLAHEIPEDFGGRLIHALAVLISR